MQKRRLTIIIVGIIAVIVIFAGIDYFILGEPSSTTELSTSAREIDSPVPAKEVKSISESSEPSAPVITTEVPVEPALSTYEQKMKNLRKLIADIAAANKTQEVTVVFTEAEVNEQAAKWITSAQISEDLPLEIESVHIDLKTGNNILADIGASIYGLTGTIKIESQVSVEAGEPVAEVTDVSVPLPGIKETISELAQQKIEALLDQLAGPQLAGNEAVDIEYTEITTQEEDITIKLLVKPRA